MLTWFLAYIRHIGSALKSGDCVIMDNLSPHKTPEVETLIRGTGADIRWLPAYVSGSESH